MKKKSGEENKKDNTGCHAIIQPLNENYSFDAENEAGGQKGGQNEDSKTAQKTTQKILDAISNNPNVTRLELSEICGITADGVKWQLRNIASAVQTQLKPFLTHSRLSVRYSPTALKLLGIFRRQVPRLKDFPRVTFFTRMSRNIFPSRSKRMLLGTS